MLEKQESLPLSPYSNLYDLIIEKDNELRRINELIDFSFIYKELEDNYCLTNGRNAICPVRMFKYLLLKRMYKLSDRDVVKRSKYDMSFKYFLDMAPEDSVIDPSSLTQFRKLRLKDINLLDLLIQKTIELAVEHDLIDVKATLIVDATHSHSRHRSRSAGQYLNEHAKAVRKATYEFDESLKEKYPEKPTDEHDVKVSMAYCEKLIEVVEKEDVRNIPAVQEKMNYLKELVEECQETTELSADRDARTGHKSEDTSFFGYKTHLAISDERLIVAAEVTSGEKSDGKYLRNLVEKSEKAGLTVETVLGDTAYSGKDNLILAKEKEFQLVSKLNPMLTNERKDTGFEFNKDADMYVCPAGHLATKKYVKNRKDRNAEYQYQFDIEKCKVCPLRDGCYKEGAKSKTLTVSIKSTEHQEQKAFQETELFKELARDRYMIEAKNSELKNRHGYDKATDSGLFGMEIQGATTIFVTNLKRIMKLIDQK
ncbi:Transposase domain [Oceanobacillus limi]|uniref:Transposase domain n=1 Tax=Oceanobacillus limi TaxID=930131 RepID=A0A1I0AYV5_9BACI|nr:IS1182 family transposase [Oceanobacillus limi]SES99199.1 Transposase domain [Oceanobacillus limi]